VSAKNARSGLVLAKVVKKPELLFIRDSAGNFENSEKRLRWNIDAPHALHAPLAFFLLLQEFALARNIAAVALGDHVFANRADRLGRHHAAANGGLDSNFEHLPRNQLP